MENAPRGLEPFDVIEDLDIIPTRDHVIIQRVTLKHGSILLADATGVPKQGQDVTPQDFFGYVLAAGPGRYSSSGELLPMRVEKGMFVRVDGRLMFHTTPSHKKVWLGSEDVVIATFKPEKSALL